MHVVMPVMMMMMMMMMMVVVMPVMAMVVVMPVMMMRRHRHIGGHGDRGHGGEAHRDRCREQAFLKHY
jgi:heme/copper-type cytochrome/quinol oxidase subunit 2